MDEQQLTDIRTYLLDKKLPIDILVEVYDHFTTQISELQKEEGLAYEEAFEQVKDSWKDELKLYWDGSWDLHDNSKFLRKMYLSINFGVLKQTLIYGGLVLIALFLISQVTGTALFSYLFTAAMVLLTVIPLIQYLRRRPDFDLAKKYSKYVLTYYQHSPAIFFGSFAVLIPNLERIFNHSHAVFSIFRFVQPAFSMASSLFPWIVLLFLIFGNALVFIIQMNYLTQIHKVKPFLKFLKPSR